MKRNLITLIVVLCGICVYAQPSRGQGGGQGGPGMPPPRGEMRGGQSGSNDNLVLEHFPEIPNLTLKQREQVGSVLTKERKEIIKQMDKMRELDHNRTQNPSAKELEKQDKAKAKIDKKIKDTEAKSNKKIQKILTDYQYQVYLEKRNEFKFKEPGKHRPMRRDNQDQDSNRPPLPDDGQFDNFND